jgi:hypothetical protein
LEGGQLRASKTILAHYSPFFRAMFFGELKEKDAKEITLKGKSFDDMKLLFELLLPREVPPTDRLNGKSVFPNKVNTLSSSLSS